MRKTARFRITTVSIVSIILAAGLASAQTETPTPTETPTVTPTPTPTAYAMRYRIPYDWKYGAAAEQHKINRQIAHDLAGIATAAGYTLPVLSEQFTPTPTPTRTITPTRTPTPTVTP